MCNVVGAERRFVSKRSDREVAPVHFSNQNDPGNEFETTPPVSGDILNSDSGREDPNRIRGYRDADFEIPLFISKPFDGWEVRSDLGDAARCGIFLSDHAQRSRATTSWVVHIHDTY